MISSHGTLRHTTWLLSGLGLLFAVVWQAPALHAAKGLANYLPLHMFAETFSIVVSMMVFGIAWNAYIEERPGNIVILACASLAVGLIDFAHMLSFKGMPDFITPSGPEKAINLWLSARLLAALMLLAIAVRPWRPLTNPRSRYWMLAGSLAAAVWVVWLGLVYPQDWPRTFIAGQGLTPFKIGAEYAIIAILLIPAARFYQQAKAPQSFDVASLFAATAITILSELCFTLYSDVADIFNLLGHLYKIVAYIFIYRAVFMGSVREPFKRLDAESVENRRISKELKDASLYTRSLIEASLDPLVTISAEGKITDVNRATEQVTGVGRDLLTGTDFSACFTEPDKARAGYMKVFEQGSVIDYPLSIRHQDGHITNVLYNASVYRNEAGEVLGVFAAARDVTGLKRAEDALRERERFLSSIIENIPDMIFLKDARELKFVRINKAGEGLLGLRREELLGKNDYDFFPREQADFFTGKDRKVLESGQMQDIPEEPVNTKAGERILHTKKLSIPDSMGNPAFLLGISEDITERKRIENEIRELNRNLERRVAERTADLEAANKELEAFSYSVSHDLRTPLRAIDGFSRLLLEEYSGKLDEEGRRLLNVVRKNTGRMARLIDDILRFGRAGRVALVFDTIDMERMARAVLDELKPQAGNARLQAFIGHLPPARGDSAMMRQVFVNLLSNAIKFSRGRETPVIRVEASVEGGETVYVVKDNGAGFDMRYAHKLFGVFQRLHGVDEFEGTGIGLAIVKRIVARHGGRVWAEGKSGEGASVYFSLPHAEIS